MIFKSEGDVRGWVRANAGRRVFWIEAARGGTDGLQDCLIVFDGRLVPVELKIGNQKRHHVDYALRSSQKQIAYRMSDLGVESFVLTGIRGTSELTVETGYGAAQCWVIGVPHITTWGEFEAFVLERIG